LTLILTRLYRERVHYTVTTDGDPLTTYVGMRHPGL